VKVLVTGAAGFIGYHTVLRLLQDGDEVSGLDSINGYYDPTLKYDRLKNVGIEADSAEYGRMVKSRAHTSFEFIRMDLTDQESIIRLVTGRCFDAVCNLAAQAGVRYSLVNPFAYSQSNLQGFLNILEAAKRAGVRHFVYASSSSVYGLNETMPFSVHHKVDHPVSLYGAIKKANELFVHSYSHVFGILTTGLRFFTVYGPWGRPDIALSLFTKAMMEGKAHDVLDFGEMKRDFTCVDDIVEGLSRVIRKTATPDAAWDPKSPDPGSSVAPFRVYNLGNGSPVKLTDFIAAIEEAVGKKATLDFLPKPMGEVTATWADTAELERDFGYRPQTSIRAGISRFVMWYRSYYKV
jgi:UDP-glucuronate 4-epimerase